MGAGWNYGVSMSYNPFKYTTLVDLRRSNLWSKMLARLMIVCKKLIPVRTVSSSDAIAHPRLIEEKGTYDFLLLVLKVNDFHYCDDIIKKWHV